MQYWNDPEALRAHVHTFSQEALNRHLARAVHACNYESVAVLLMNGADPLAYYPTDHDPNQTHPSAWEESLRFAPEHKPAQKRRFHFLLALLDPHADMRTEFHQGNRRLEKQTINAYLPPHHNLGGLPSETALTHAIRHRYHYCVRLLLQKHGARFPSNIDEIPVAFAESVLGIHARQDTAEEYHKIKIIMRHLINSDANPAQWIHSWDQSMPPRYPSPDDGGYQRVKFDQWNHSLNICKELLHSIQYHAHNPPNMADNRAHGHGHARTL